MAAQPEPSNDPITPDPLPWETWRLGACYTTLPTHQPCAFIQPVHNGARDPLLQYM